MSIEFNTPHASNGDAKNDAYFNDAVAKDIPRSQMNHIVDHSESGIQKRTAAADRTHELAQQLVGRSEELLGIKSETTEGEIA